MLRRFAVSLSLLSFAGLILLITILRSASVKYEFTGEANAKVLGGQTTQIDYYLAFPGKVLPDSPLWPVKATRDKLWLVTTTDNARKAELLLLFADKRMAASKILFEKGNPEEGYSSLTKAEHYLKLACDQSRANVDEGLDTADFLTRLALASLKHRQIIEEEILVYAPDDARPEIVQTLETTKYTFEQVSHSLNKEGISVPNNPFDGE